MATWTLVIGASMVQKWAVQPVSAMAGAEERVGGPIGMIGAGRTAGTGTASGSGVATAGVIVLAEQDGIGETIGFPPCQSGAGVVVPPREEEERPPPRRMVLLPPII